MSYGMRGLTLQQRLEVSYIKNDNGCWEWKKATHSNGYGTLTYNKKQIKAHRASYLTFIGEIPSGMYVCHRCDNKKCINPEHLFLGTPLDNMKDKVKKNRQSKGKTLSNAIKKSEKYQKAKCKGEKHGMSKLSDLDREDILKRLKQGETQAQIAKLYGVTPSNISHIKRKYK